MSDEMQNAVDNINAGVRAIIGTLATVQDNLSTLIDLNQNLVTLSEKQGIILPKPSPAVTVPVGTAPGDKVHPQSGFKLGAASQKKLLHLHYKLRTVVELAIQWSTLDFTVYETIRTLDQQKAYMAKGVTRTMKSKHLEQSDGYSHAVDLVPYINGKPVWDWDGCYSIACAMDRAATHLGLAGHIRWGGAWDRVLADFGNEPAAYKKEVENYKQRHGGTDFIDGPHYEWVA